MSYILSRMATTGIIITRVYWQFLLVLVSVVCTTPVLAANFAQVFLANGNVVSVATDSFVIGKENRFKTLDDPEYREIVTDSTASSVVFDYARHRALILFGRVQTDMFAGYLAVSTLEDKAVVGAIALKDSTGTPNAQYNKNNSEIYVSYYLGQKRYTSIYDARNYKKLKENSGNQISVSPGSCFLDNNEFYSNGRIFSVKTNKAIRVSKFRGKPYLPVACESGYVALLSDAGNLKDKQNLKPLITIVDAKRDDEVKELQVGEKMSSFNADEWYLSSNAQHLVRDLQEEELQGNVRSKIKPGILQIYSIRTGDHLGEVKLPIKEKGTTKRLLGFSKNGTLLFYSSNNSLFIIDVSQAKLRKVIDFSTAPVGVEWFD